MYVNQLIDRLRKNIFHFYFNEIMKISVDDIYIEILYHVFHLMLIFYEIYPHILLFLFIFHLMECNLP